MAHTWLSPEPDLRIVNGDALVNLPEAPATYLWLRQQMRARLLGSFQVCLSHYPYFTALVGAGYVKESELPSFIMPGQAYYWVRGDVVNPALVGFAEEGESAYLDVLTLAYEQLLSMMNKFGGIKIPYIMAAKARDVYGSPQQTYMFNNLLRGFELTGI